MDLIENNWKYNEIDNMDIHGFLRLMQSSKDDKPSKKNRKNKQGFDDIEAFYNSI